MYIASQYSQQTESLIIVMPNQRSGHFLKKYLSETIPKAIWSPQIYDLRTWVFNQVNFRMIEPVDLIFKLYSSYRKIQANGSNFEEFYPWGEIILSDFDELDKNLINPIQLFSNIIDYQEIKSDFSYLSERQLQSIRHFFENFIPGPDEGIKQKSTQIWNLLPDLYREFSGSLVAEKSGYEGIAYRIFAEDQSFTPDRNQKYLFIGFNALYESERKILKRYQLAGNAEFFFDYDELYLKDELHEAGHFLRQNLADFFMPQSFLELAVSLSLFKQLSTLPKKLRAFTLSSDQGQASLLAELLEKNSKESTGEPDEIAIVLPDESILPSILTSFPESIPSVNVSLGYPLKSTKAAGLSELIYQLQRSKSEDSRGQTAWNRNALMELLRHDYLNTENHPDQKAVLLKLSKSSRAYHRLNEESGLLSIITRGVRDGTEFIQLLEESYRFLLENPSNELPELEKEFIYQYLLAVSKFKYQLQELPESPGIEMGFRIFNRSLRKQKIAFKGEPLKGVQIIGPLETRLLDFRHLIILSLNEGTFPPQSFTPSFIPYSIKQGFGLQTREMKDSVYSYYFYRLLQRTEQADFFIPSTSSGGNRSEPSRFIHQLNYSRFLELSHESAGNKLSIAEGRMIQVPKSQEITNSINWLSPTSLNYYLDCPLKFYFRFVLKVKAEKEQTEAIGMPEFGNLIHYFMQQLYLEGGMIESDKLETLIRNEKELKERLMEAFTHFGFAEENQISLSENRLIFENLLTYIKALLRADMAYAPFEIIGTESEIQLEMPYQNGMIQIRGSIDRIDRKNHMKRIIDYKTGKDDENAKSIEKLFDVSDNSRKKAIFQILLYSIAFKRKHTDLDVIQAYIFNLKKVFENNFDGLVKINKVQMNLSEIETEFMQRLQDLIDEIFDLNIPYYQTKEEKKCQTCDFNLICKR